MKAPAQPALIASAFVSFAILAWCAWLCDDIFITLRQVDNWTNGFGLTWNPGERVQAFSHPLWMLIVSATTIMTGGDERIGTFFACFCASAAVLGLFVHQARETWPAGVAVIA